jgi:hypothetical protein
MTPVWKDKKLFKQPVKKEYHWTVEASGCVDAESYEEAKKMVKDEAEGLVMDDRKYWRIEVGEYPVVLLEEEYETGWGE